MIKRLSFDGFVGEFSSYGREDQFSYEALRIIYDYLDEVYEENYELDVIAICCEFSESDYDELREIFDDEDLDDSEVLKELEILTTVVGSTSETIVYVSY